MLLLAGDNGGTNTRLCLVEASDSGGQGQTLYKQQYQSNNYQSLIPMIEEFLASAQQQLQREFKPETACFALAGPVENHSICPKITNLDWPPINARELETVLDIKKINLLNDFEAIGYGILGLDISDPEDVFVLQEGTPQDKASISVLGAGTGLGQAYLTCQGSYTVNSSEGSHADYAPHSRETSKLLDYLIDKSPKVDGEEEEVKIDIEEVVSGRGIVAIYQFLRDEKGLSESPEIAQAIEAWERDKTDVDAPAVIAVEASQDGGNFLCQKTMALWFEAYGAAAGNFALQFLPRKGVYVAGGIAAKNLQLLTESKFMSVFVNKNKMNSLLKTIPVYVVKNQAVGLLGAAIYAQQM